MEPHPAVTVILPTFERPRLLGIALDALLSQRAPGIPFEVIVVDNAAHDVARDIVEARRGAVAGGPRLHYMREERPGVAFARNTGIARARGDIIAFTDDDEAVAPDWIAVMVRLFDEHPDAAFVAGRVMPGESVRFPSWLEDWHWGTLGLMDRGDSPFRVDRNRRGYGWLSSGNLAVRRPVFDAVGMFNPTLQRVRDGIGSIEDHDLVMRICLSGRHGFYAPELLAAGEVPAERLGKRYHRRWQSGNGRYCAHIRLLEAGPETVSLFGVPGPYYRELARHAARFMLAIVRGRRDRAFHHELRVRWGWNYVCTSWRRYEGRGWVREFAAVGKVLAARRYHRLTRHARLRERGD